MKTLSQIFGIIAFALFIQCTPEATTGNEKVYIKHTYDFKANETELIDLVNQYRAGYGLNRLETVEHAAYLAHEHNQYMMTNNVVAHTGFVERADNLKATENAMRVSENIAYGLRTNEGVIKAWNESEGHQKTLVGDFTHIGLAITTNNDNRTYVTAIFLKK